MNVRCRPEKALAAVLLLCGLGAPGSAQSPIEGVLQDVSSTPPQAAIGDVIEDICPAGVIASADLQARCNDLVIGLLRDGDVNGARAALQAMAPEENSVVASTLVDTSVTQRDAVGARLEAVRKGVAGGRARSFAVQWNGRSVIGPGSGAHRALASSFPAADTGRASTSGSPRIRPAGSGMPTPGLAALPIPGLELGGQSEAESSSDASEYGDVMGRWGLFLSANLQTGDRDPTPSESGFDFDAYALTLGADYRVSDKLVIGFAFGAEDEESSLLQNGGGLDTEGLRLSLQGAFFPSDRTFVELIAGIGSSDLDQERAIRYSLGGLAINQVALGETDADHEFGSFAFGVDLGSGGWIVTPEVRADYLSVSVDAFRESVSRPNAPGSGLGLNIGAQEFESLTTSLGLQATFAKSTSWGVLIPQFSAEYTREHENAAETITGHFVGDPTLERFFLRNDDPVESYGTAGIGLLAVLSSGRSFYLFYETLIGHDQLSSQSLGFGVRMEL